MSKKDLRNEEILEKEEQLNEGEEILEEEVDGNCRHIIPCLSNTRKKCEYDCWPAANCYLSCNK
ncbi:MAG: hypothetical protein IJ094_12060 [Bacilli bacterium]|nr:hypothetical protein [Bacilli bacterium]